MLLSACGGGGSKRSEPVVPEVPEFPSEGSSGKVIDGYVSGARVFRDANNNNRYDAGEKFVLSDGYGGYTNLQGSANSKIIADNNDGSAIDVGTGFPYSITLSAPSTYEIVSPLSTLVQSVSEKGYSSDIAASMVKSVLGLPFNVDLATFDAVHEYQKSVSTSSKNDAEQVLLSNLKIANILIFNDGAKFSERPDVSISTLNNFSDLIIESNSTNTVLDLANQNVLKQILPANETAMSDMISSLNKEQNYLELVDDLLQTLGDNLNEGVSVSNNNGTSLLVFFVGENSQSLANFIATLSNSTTGSTASSIDIVANGSQYAVFKFNSDDLVNLGTGNILTRIFDKTTGKLLDVNNDFTILRSENVNAIVDTEPPRTDSGVVADGYISNARVFRDENENRQFDADEEFVISNTSGEFSELGGDPDKPIVADGNNGQAVDTSTGITFNAILSAPAGSKVVNPITTIVNELLQDSASGASSVEAANLMVANAFGLTAVKQDGALVDFTKFDPISKKIFSDDATETEISDVNLATLTQGVATYVANLVVAGANEKGGDVSAIASTTKSIIGNIKDVVKNNQASAVDLTSDAVILSALGSDFQSSSTTLEKMKTDFSGFAPSGYDPANPSATVGNFTSDKLLQKQLVAQSEFGDGVLTTAEASNGALLVLGPTYDPTTPGTEKAYDGTATLKLTNQTTSKVVYKSIKFSNGKYASVELSATELNETLGGGVLLAEVKPGSLNGTNWDSGGARIFDNSESKLYFHKDITPEITFDSSTVVTSLVNGAATVKAADTSFTVSGKVKIDIGTSNLPSGITLRHLVDGLDTSFDGTGRAVTLEFLDSAGDVKFVLKPNIEPVTGASNATGTTGSSTFNWSKTFDGTEASVLDNTIKFSSLNDGAYSIRASFIDAYGAVTDAAASTFKNLTIDRSPPEVSGKILANDTEINAADGNAVFLINLTEAANSLDTSKIKFDVNSTETTLATEISAEKATANFNSDNEKLTISYTPAQTGTVNLEILPEAFVDAAGNLSTSAQKTSSVNANEIKYDFVAPTVAVSVVNASKTFNPASESLNLNTEAGLKAKFQFSEAVESFSLSDVSISSIGGTKAANLIELTGSDQTADNITWYAGLDLVADLQGTLTLGVNTASYTDTYGNLGSASSVTFQQDTKPASVFQVALKSDTEKATYGYGDAIYIIVTFDSEIASSTGTPSIELTIGGVKRNATFVKIDESDATKVHFSYAVTKANGDLSDSNGISVASSISGGTLIGTDGNATSLDLSTATQPLDLSGKVVDAGTDGAAVDGYVEGAIIYADNDTSGNLTPGDPIAQANATGGFSIYGASGPLVLEGGFDISTNKEFNARYKAPGDANTTYTVINPITTLVNQVNSGSLTTAESTLRTAIGNPLTSADKLRTYNAYEAIAEAGDAAANTDAVSSVVLDALKYQKAAASVALITDFVASSSFYATGSPSSTSIQEKSDAVFNIIGNNLSTFMQLFVGKSFSSFYDASGNLLSIENNVSSIKSGLQGLFGSTPGFSTVSSDFSETFDVLATALSAINSVSFQTPTNSTNPDNILAAAELGIDALTEIVQVQTVIQTNYLSEIASYYGSNKTIAAPTITVNRFLGTDDSNGYPSTPVGTVVPIRYSIEIPANKSDSSANAVQFEADENGLAAEYEFTITRSGSVKTNSQLDYEIVGSISADDIVGGVLSGSLYFDVNEKTKTLKVSLNNDAAREATETLTVIISDPTGTSQIVEERASATIKDDDPSTPEISIQRASYNLSEDGEVFIDDASIDYFDQNASFAVTWASDGGTLSASIDGSSYTQGSYISYYDLQTDLLRNLKFTADTQSATSTTGAVLLNIKAAENSDGTGRSSQSELQLTFDVERKPTVDISNVSFDAGTSFAGLPMKISGITIEDVDSEFVTVTVSSTIDGIISTSSNADFTLTEQGQKTIAISGSLTNVGDALSNLTFQAEKAGDVKFNISVDDGDQLHARDTASGLLIDTGTQTRLSTSVSVETTAHSISASAPKFLQSFEPNVKVGAGFWNGFTGIEVSDIDSDSITVIVTSALDAANGNTPKVNFRFLDNSNPAIPLIINKSNDFSISGSPSFVTEQLKQLQVEMLVNETDLVTFSVYDGEAVTSSNKIEFKPSYVAMDNAVPDPGGNIASSTAILEDSGESQINFTGIRLYDSDALEGETLVAPKFVRILSSEGGAVKTAAGASIIDTAGAAVDIPVSNGALTIRFTPDENFNGKASLKYVVVDPQQSNFSSPISELTATITPVNDKPVLTVSNIPAIYIQGQEPVSIFQSVNLTDVDSSAFTEIKINSNIDLTKNDLPLFTPDGMFGLTKTVSQTALIFDGSTLSASDVRSFLSSIKFQNTSNNLVDQSRIIEVTVTDDQGSESEVAKKTILMRDVNDGPEIKNGDSTSTFVEDNQTGILLSSFGSVSDPEGNNITKLVAKIAAGYKFGQDIFEYSGTLSGVEVGFDTASGAVTVSATDGSTGISASDVNTILTQLTYKNISQNPDAGVSKKIVFEITDILGETSISDIKTINITPVNDKPELFIVVGNSEATTGSGPQFVQGGGAVRIAPTVNLRDVDSSGYKTANIERTSNHGGVLSLTSSGEKLAQALGVTVENVSASKISIYKTAANDANFINTADLTSILREISYSNTNTNLDGKTASIKFDVVDSASATSAVYTSNIKLLDEPSVDVKLQVISDDANFSNTTDKNGNETANVLTFNQTFSANQLTIDLSASTIRTDTGRFKYDPSITALKIPLNQAGHLDLRSLSGTEAVTTTKIIGQLNSDVLYGSQFNDFIDGNGGLDVIRAGAGSDTVAARIDTSGSIYDGGTGVDTLILSQNFAGTFDLGSANSGSITVTSNSKSVVISNFENIDARSLNSSIDLRGDASDNVLMGGKADDTIWLTGGKDIVSGGDGADVFVIDIGTIDATGSKILDVTSSDKIKFVNSGGNYLTTSQLNWFYGEDAATKASNAATQDVWIAQQSGNYYLNVEVGSGTKSVDLGSEIFGAPGKWIFTDGNQFTLQPEQNIRPKFDATKLGPATSINKPAVLTGTSGNYSLSLTSGNALGVIDSDNDPLKLNVIFSGGAVSLEGSNISSDFEKLYNTPTDLNTALATLSITGSERGSGKLVLNVTDTYSPIISKEIFFSVPNSKPTISVSNFNKNTPPKTEIQTPIKLSDAGISFSINDIDSLDISDKALDILVSITGASVAYNGEYSSFVQISGNNVIISHDGVTELAANQDWSDVLEEILSDIEFSNSIVGRATVGIKVSDAGNLFDDLGSNPILIDFEAKPLATPQLIAATENLQQLNGPQFDTAKVRVFLKDIGARVGDKVLIKTKIGGTSQTDVEKIINAAPNNAEEVVPYIDVALSDLVSGSSRDGAFTINAELMIDGSKASETAIAATFVVDTQGASTPQIRSLNNNEAGAEITGEDILSVSVANAEDETGLAHSLVKIFAPNDGSWYSFSNTFDLKSLLLGSGAYQGELTPNKETYDDTSKQYLLEFDNKLADGVYAIISRDSAGNVSSFDATNFDFATKTLPNGMFVVDQKLDKSALNFDLLNASEIPGENYKLYQVSLAQSKSVQLSLESNSLGGEIADDIVKLSVQVWDKQSDLGSQEITPKIDATFTRDLTVSTNHWSLASGTNAVVSLDSGKLKPIFDLKFSDAMPNVSGNIAMRIIAEDVAGNKVEIDSQGNQILLDVTADALVEGAANSGKVTSLIEAEDYQGVSIPDAAHIDISLIGIDSDVVSRSTYFLSTAQIEANLKLTSDNSSYSGKFADLVMDQGLYTLGSGKEVPLFSDGASKGAVYLDLNSAFVDSLKLKSDGVTGPDTPGSPSDWKYIRTLDGKAEYIAATDYNKFVSQSEYTPTIYVSNFVVNTHVDGQYLTSLSEISQDISAMLPAENSPDQPLYVFNQVTDLSGNTSYSTDLLPDDNLEASVQHSLNLDVTPPSEPSVFIDRINNGIDFWESSETIHFTISETGAGDSLIADSVKFNGTEADYDSFSGYYSFSIPDTLPAGTYNISQDLIDATGNVKTFTQGVNITRSALTDFAIVPHINLISTDYEMIFDVYINTELSKFSNAKSIDLAFEPPNEYFDYFETRVSSDLNMYALNDANPDLIWFSGIDTDSFDKSDDPIFSIVTHLKSETFSPSSIRDDLQLRLVLVDESPVVDFVYNLDLSDILVDAITI
jgi:hypothetical protein